MKKSILLIVLFVFASVLAACSLSGSAEHIAQARLDDYSVVNSDGASVAQVESVILTEEDGQIRYAILLLPGDPFMYGMAAFMDASEPRIAVPWEYLSVDSEAHQLHLNVSSETLHAAPLFKLGDDRLESGWDADVLSYWQFRTVAKN